MGKKYLQCTNCKKHIDPTGNLYGFILGKGIYHGPLEIYCLECYEWESSIRDKDNEVNSLYEIKLNQAIIDEIKTFQGCILCGEDTSSTLLEFHHINRYDKIDSIAAIRNQASQERLFNEIKKCVVLCANCHRLVHDRERNKEPFHLRIQEYQ
jgi:5-methylcytosine-specific restriction endonuclease McrA